MWFKDLYEHFLKLLWLHNTTAGCAIQGFSWTKIYFGLFVQAAPIFFGHLKKIEDIF